MCVSGIQWLYKPSHWMQGPYSNIECIRVTSGLLGAAWQIYGLPNTARKNEERGIPQSVIPRHWQQFQDDGNVSRCYSTGHPRVTTPNEDRYLAVIAKRNRWNTALDLTRQLFSATSMTVSRQTVYRRLGHIGLYARRPVRCVPLTATHCRL
ncbi:HTH_Tnp_Tc3_2 domain-containing protein [Trichonephila clavipes]|nr:HTH_Tnp_Tc3_2 domain-containing protein [Trichonephila clavipes]